MTSIVSVQSGAVIAHSLMPTVGAMGAVALRQVTGAVVLMIVVRPWRVAWTGREIWRAALFAGVFVAMNSTLYLAIGRLPLGTVVTLEFLGPLVLSLVTARGAGERLWAVPAGIGVALLGGSLRAEDLLGVAFALAAAICWAAYILLAGRVGRGENGVAGLTMATALGAVIALPVAVVTTGPVLWQAHSLLLGLAVGLLSTAVPYTLDMFALRRLPTAVFGVLTSLNPAVSALLGALFLSQHLPMIDLAGIGLVVLAGLGIAVGTGRNAARRP